jgi:glycogen operon protein
MVEFTLPEVPQGQHWKLQLDTNVPDLEPGAEFSFGDSYQVTGRSTLMFELAVRRKKKR